MVFAVNAPSSLAAGELQNERIWRSPGGKTLLATYIRTSADGKKVDLLTSNGQVVSIGMDNLSEADRLLVSRGPTSGDGQDAAQPGDTSAFKTLPDPDREKLPVISQGDFGSKASDCVPSSFCNFLLWWDQEGTLKIPKRGDFEDKAEWVHTRVARYCVTRNTRGTSADKAVEGFRKYFEKELEGVATMKIGIDRDISPANLARYTTGPNATMLEVTIREKPRHDSSHWVALLSASADGAIVFHTWGARFEGRMELLEMEPETKRSDARGGSKASYRIRITNPDKLPDWFKTSGRELIVDPANWDGLCIIKPYVYAEEGKPAKAPPDPLMDRIGT